MNLHFCMFPKNELIKHLHVLLAIQEILIFCLGNPGLITKTPAL
jgi:hypothetical protein